MAADPGSIFICYRRDDSADVAGRIYDRLVSEFGREAIYRDVDTIPFGADFREHVHACLATCRVGFVIIGPEWCTIQGRAGLPRLHEPADHVRLEVEAMLGRRDIQTIPLYVRSAAPPQPEELPEILQPIAFKNGADIRRDPDFHHDMDRVLEQLRPLLLKQTKKDPHKTAPNQSPTPPRTSPRDAPGSTAAPDSRSFFRRPFNWFMLFAVFGALGTWLNFGTSLLTGPPMLIAGVYCIIEGRKRKQPLIFWTGLFGFLFCAGLIIWYNENDLSTSIDRVPIATVCSLYAAIVGGLWLTHLGNNSRRSN